MLRNHLLFENLQWNYASFNVTLIFLMNNQGIFRDIFGSRQLRATILSNSWQWVKPAHSTDRQTDLPSNFLKIARLLGKIKHTVSLRFISLSFGAKIVLWEDISLLAMNSLYSEKGNDRYLWSGGKTFTPCASRAIIFQREKFKLFKSLFHSVYLVFSIRLISIADLFAVRYLWDVSNEDKCILVASLGLFTWVVYVRKYCMPIATLNQNKRSWLLYLSDAQIINITMWKYCWKGFIWIVTP